MNKARVILLLIAIFHLGLIAYFYSTSYKIQEDQLHWTEAGIRLAKTGELYVLGFNSSYPSKISFGFCPGLPVIVAGCYFMSFGNVAVTLLLVRLAQAAASMFSCWFIMLLAHRLRGKTAAITAGILYASFPVIFWQAFLILKEIWGLLGVTVTLFLLWEAIEKGRLSYYALTGFAGGITTFLIKQTEFLMFFLALSLWALDAAKTLVPRLLSSYSSSWRISRAGIALMILLQCLTLSPWAIRNYIISSKEYPNLTPVLLYPQERFVYTRIGELLLGRGKKLASSSTTRSRGEKSLSASHASGHSSVTSRGFILPDLLRLEQNNFWDILFNHKNMSLLKEIKKEGFLKPYVIGKIFNYLVWFFIICLAMIGIIFSFKNLLGQLLCLTIIYFLLAIIIDSRGTPRFLFPSLGCWIALAGAGGARILEALKGWRSPLSLQREAPSST